LLYLLLGVKYATELLYKRLPSYPLFAVNALGLEKLYKKCCAFLGVIRAQKGITAKASAFNFGS
jgi:hypothetical protein